MTATGISLVTDDSPYPASPTYASLTPYVTSVQTSRGRPDEFSGQQAGQATLGLNNRTGAFDSTNSGSPFVGKLLGLRQLKINFKHPIRNTYHDIYTGYVENWDYKREGPRAATTTATLVDMMALLANADVNTALGGAPYGAAYAAQHWDDRIKAALADAGVPSSWYEVSTGNINCQGHIYTAGSKCLEVITDAVEGEFPGVSNCFVTAGGKFRASGRFIRGVDGSDPTSVYPSWSKAWEVGDAAACALDPGLLPIADLEWHRGKDTIFNAALVTPEGATAGAITTNYVKSPASITKYGRWAKSIEGLMILDGDDGNSGLDECKTFANWIIANYGDGQDRISSISFRGQMDDGTTTPGGAAGNLWDFIFGVEINHIIFVTTYNPPGQIRGDGTVDTSGGGFSTTEFFVEGIHHDISRLNNRVPRWTMSLDLSRRATTNWSSTP